MLRQAPRQAPRQAREGPREGPQHGVEAKRLGETRSLGLDMAFGHSTGGR
ncbi:MAG: hypothetical protein ACE5HA_05725 [Anaerolineae bacterium]